MGCMATRNIPACAGKTSRTGARNWYGKEHPRVRGENLRVYEAARLHAGTSPRARGKLSDSIFLKINVGNIPACAGKT